MNRITKARGRGTSKTVAFQQGGTIIRIPIPLIKRAMKLHAPYDEAKPLLFEPWSENKRGIKRLILIPVQQSKAPNKETRKIQRRHLLTAWKSGPHSQCLYISSASILRALELDRTQVAGREFPTTAVPVAGNIVVAIGRASSLKAATDSE